AARRVLPLAVATLVLLREVAERGGGKDRHEERAVVYQRPGRAGGKLARHIAVEKVGLIADTDGDSLECGQTRADVAEIAGGLRGLNTLDEVIRSHRRARVGPDVDHIGLGAARRGGRAGEVAAIAGTVG